MGSRARDWRFSKAGAQWKVAKSAGEHGNKEDKNGNTKRVKYGKQ